MNMMNDEQFRKEANKIVDYIIEFRNSLPDQRVIPGADIKPYTLRKLLSGKFQFLSDIATKWNFIFDHLDI